MGENAGGAALVHWPILELLDRRAPHGNASLQSSVGSEIPVEGQIHPDYHSWLSTFMIPPRTTEVGEAAVWGVTPPLCQVFGLGSAPDPEILCGDLVQEDVEVYEMVSLGQAFLSYIIARALVLTQVMEVRNAHEIVGTYTSFRALRTSFDKNMRQHLKFDVPKDNRADFMRAYVGYLLITHPGQVSRFVAETVIGYSEPIQLLERIPYGLRLNFPTQHTAGLLLAYQVLWVRQTQARVLGETFFALTGHLLKVGGYIDAQRLKAVMTPEFFLEKICSEDLCIPETENTVLTFAAHVMTSPMAAMDSISYELLRAFVFLDKPSDALA